MDETEKKQITELQNRLLEYAVSARKNGILSLSPMIKTEMNQKIRGGLEIVLHLGEKDELEHFFDKSLSAAEGAARIETRMIFETCRGIRDGLHPEAIKEILSGLTD